MLMLGVVPAMGFVTWGGWVLVTALLGTEHVS